MKGKISETTVITVVVQKTMHVGAFFVGFNAPTLRMPTISQISPTPTPSIDVVGTVGVILFFVVIIFAISMAVRAARAIRPTERGLIERFGKYHRFANPGLTFLMPFVDRLVRVNITERISPVEPQEVITKDKVVMNVDAVVFFKVKEDESSVKASEYAVNNFTAQIEILARTTLRNIIGNLDMAEANAQREKINEELKKSLEAQSQDWGVDILRAELKDLIPPKEIQESMNSVIVADNQRIAAANQANAVATQADGEKRAAIARAEGAKQAAILQSEGLKQATINAAEGDAQATKLRNEAITTYFKDSAITFKQLDTVAASLESNSKIVVPEGQVLTLILNESENVAKRIVPVPTPQTTTKATTDKKGTMGYGNP